MLIVVRFECRVWIADSCQVRRARTDVQLGQDRVRAIRAAQTRDFALLVAQIAENFHTLFDPAAYVFWIWSLVYVGLLAFGVYQVLPSQWNNPRVRATDGLFGAT